jgi:hypothetical protein
MINIEYIGLGVTGIIVLAITYVNFGGLRIKYDRQN